MCCVCMCMCVVCVVCCMCVCVCCVCVCVCVCMSVCVHNACLRMSICVVLVIYVHIFVCIRICIYSVRFMYCTYVYICMCKYIIRRLTHFITVLNHYCVHRQAFYNSYRLHTYVVEHSVKYRHNLIVFYCRWWFINNICTVKFSYKNSTVSVFC